MTDENIYFNVKLVKFTSEKEQFGFPAVFRSAAGKIDFSLNNQQT